MLEGGGGGGGGRGDHKIKIVFSSWFATFLQGQINRIDCLMSAVESTVEIIRDTNGLDRAYSTP